MQRYGNATVQPGGTFSGSVPPPTPPDEGIVDGLSFSHSLEPFGTPNLIAVLGVEVIGSEAPTVLLMSLYPADLFQVLLRRPGKMIQSFCSTNHLSLISLQRSTKTL